MAAPRFAYAISKLLGEAAFLHAARAKGFAAVVGRFHNVYGPRMGADHVIPEMSLRAMRGEDPFRVPGADQYRAFCYVDDAVEAMLRLMATPGGGRADRAHRQRHARRPTSATWPSWCCGWPGVSPALEPVPAPAGSVARRCPDLAGCAR